jgi:DNA-binding NarL/FixJ family response regulator
MLDKSPHSRIVIVSGSANDERKREDIGVDRARVVGKNSSIAEILSAIRCAARGELVVASHTH